MGSALLPSGPWGDVTLAIGTPIAEWEGTNHEWRYVLSEQRWVPEDLLRNHENPVCADVLAEKNGIVVNPSLRGDISGPSGSPDCHVDVCDLMKLADEWLNPSLRSDISGPNGLPDSHADLYDLAELAEKWLYCNDPWDDRCTNQAL